MPGGGGFVPAPQDLAVSCLSSGKWEVDSMHNSLVTVGNGGNKSTRAEITILYNQGGQQYRIEQVLAPDEQILVNFAS